MIVPDFLWNPVDKDLLGAFVAQHVRRHLVSTVAAAAIDVDIYTVPADQVMWLMDCVGHSEAGAAQTCVVTELRVENQGAVAGRIARVHFGDVGNGAGQLQQDLNWSGALLLYSNDHLVQHSDFSAGAAANTARFSFHGLLMPRGNFQLG